MPSDAGPRSDPSAALSVDHTAKAKQAFAAQPVVLHHRVREREDLGTKFQHVSTVIHLYPISPGLAYLFLFVCHLLMYVLVCFPNFENPIN
jgi:hypothetical protein